MKIVVLVIELYLGGSGNSTFCFSRYFYSKFFLIRDVYQRALDNSELETTQIETLVAIEFEIVKVGLDFTNYKLENISQPGTAQRAILQLAGSRRSWNHSNYNLSDPQQSRSSGPRFLLNPSNPR